MSRSEFMTTADVVKLLGVSYGTAQRWRKRGTLKGWFKAGNGYVIPREAVEEFRDSSAGMREIARCHNRSNSVANGAARRAIAPDRIDVNEIADAVADAVKERIVALENRMCALEDASLLMGEALQVLTDYVKKAIGDEHSA